MFEKRSLIIRKEDWEDTLLKYEVVDCAELDDSTYEVIYIHETEQFLND